MSPLLCSSLSGLVWGIIVAGILPKQFGASLSLASAILLGSGIGMPIGVLVYAVSKWVYRKNNKAIVVLWAVLSLYFAAALWGAVGSGIHRISSVPLMGSHESMLEEIVAGAFICCWGLTQPSPLWAFFPLAVANHLWIWKTSQANNPAAIASAA